MRKDVKIGLVMSLILVVLAGWYYGRPADEPSAIQLDDAQTMAKRLAEKQPAKVETVPPLKPESSQESARIKPPANRSIDERDSRNKNKRADANSIAATNNPPARRTDVPAGESEQLGVLDQLVKAKSDHVDPVARSNKVGAATSAIAADVADREADGDAATERHRVRAGDTLATVADIYYGDDKLVRLLAKANPELPLTGPLPKGAKVRIPPLDDNEHDFSDREIKSAKGAMGFSKLGSSNPAARSGRDKAADSKPLRTYKVQDGDSFYTIAANELGAGSRWPELYKINKDVVGNDPNRLRAGLVLKLPANQ